MHYSQSPPLAEALDLDAISEQRIGQRPARPSTHSPRSSRLRDDRAASNRPSVGKRALRTLTRFAIAVLIGVGATLGWQAYGDDARRIAATRAPTLSWLLSVSANSPAVVATSPDPAQQLERSASNLDAMRRSVDQLAAKQDQMAQNLAALQAIEEDIRQKMVSPPPPPQPTAPIPQPKPPQPKTQASAVQPQSVPRPPPVAGPVLPTR
jgi:hypothetical protein